MFSHCFQSGDSIELYNAQKKELISKWKFTGRHSKVYDNTLKNYMHILDLGTLSKMEIPSSNKLTLGIFQSFIVFQIYLFSSKQFSIEISISDTTKRKRRLVLSTNNRDFMINQLHCRIPILHFPIGKWVNYSIDILSFVSEFYKDLTFRSVDYISFSGSGKIREIFSMRNHLKHEFDNDSYGEAIPLRFSLPPGIISENINMNVNSIVSQITIANNLMAMKVDQQQERHNMYKNKLSLNINPRQYNTANLRPVKLTRSNNPSLVSIHTQNIKELINKQEFIDVSYHPFNKKEYEEKLQKNDVKLPMIYQKKPQMVKSQSQERPRKIPSKILGNNIRHKQMYKYNNKIPRNIMEKEYGIGYNDYYNNNYNDIQQNFIMNQISTIKNENGDDRSDFEYQTKESLHGIMNDDDNDFNSDEAKKKIVAEIYEDSSHCFLKNDDNSKRPFSPPLNQNS